MAMLWECPDLVRFAKHSPVQFHGNNHQGLGETLTDNCARMAIFRTRYTAHRSFNKAREMPNQRAISCLECTVISTVSLSCGFTWENNRIRFLNVKKVYGPVGQETKLSILSIFIDKIIDFLKFARSIEPSQIWYQKKGQVKFAQKMRKFLHQDQNKIDGDFLKTKKMTTFLHRPIFKAKLENEA